jgi:hypothetical protein
VLGKLLSLPADLGLAEKAAEGKNTPTYLVTKITKVL